MSSWPLSGSPGKRLSTGEPLTEHDVAERLDKAALRVARIMSDARQQGYMDLVKHSRYMTGALSILAAELRAWGVQPDERWAAATAGEHDHDQENKT